MLKGKGGTKFLEKCPTKGCGFTYASPREVRRMKKPLTSCPKCGATLRVKGNGHKNRKGERKHPKRRVGSAS